MAMTTAQRTDAYRFFAIAFNAAPGATYMSQLFEAYSAGMTTSQIVEIYTTKPEFTSTYPVYLSNTDFATKLVNNVIKSAASDAAKAQAVSDIVTAMSSATPMTRGQVIVQVFTNLANMAYTEPTYGNVAKQLANQVVVAQYYTETMVGNSTAMSVLQSVIANVTHNTDVSTPAAIEAAMGTEASAGQTFTLTVAADTIPGMVGSGGTTATTGNDTIVATETTLSSGDVLNGGSGSDILRVGNSTVAGKNFSSFTLTNVETVQVTADQVTSFDVTGTTGVTKLVNSNSSQDLTFTGIGMIPASGIALSNVSGGNTTATFTADAVSGSADTLALALDNNKTIANGVVGTITVDGIETVNVTTSGGASMLTAIASNKLKSMSVSGDKSLTLAGATFADTSAVNTLNASGLTGTAALNVTLSNSGSASIDVAVTGGAGADRANFSNGFDTSDSFTGGDGRDTLALTQAVATAQAAATGGTVSGVEILEVTDGGTGTVSMANFSGVDTVYYSGGLAAAVTQSNAVTGLTVQVDVGPTAQNSTTTLKTNGSADVISFAFNKIAATGDALGTISAAEFETVNIKTSDDTDVGVGVLTVAALTATVATTLNIEGNAKLTLTTANNPATAVLKTVNAGSATAAVTISGLNLASSGATVTLGSGDDTFNVATASGADTFDLSKGGADTIVYTAVAQSDPDMDSITGFTSGNDFIDLRTFVSPIVASSQFVGTKATFGEAQGALLTSIETAVFDASSSILWVDKDKNGTLDANDFRVKLVGVTSLTAADLKLSATGNTVTLTAPAAVVNINTKTGADAFTTNEADTIKSTAANLVGSSIDGLLGTDVLVMQDAVTALAIGAALQNIESLTLADGTNSVASFAGTTDFKNVTGGTGADTLTTTANLVAGGSISLGDGSDVITALAADLAGSTIDMGAGDDSLTSTIGGAITATLKGGSGTDTLALAAADDISGGAVSGFENLTTAATATMTGSQLAGFTGTVTNGGTITATGSTSNITGTAGLLGAGDTLTFSTAASTNTVTLSGNGAATINGNTGADTVTGTDTDVNALTLFAGSTGSDVLNITSFDSATDLSTNITAVETVKLTGTGTGGTLTLDAGAAVTLVDFSELTASGITYTSGAQATAGYTVKGSAFADTIANATTAVAATYWLNNGDSIGSHIAAFADTFNITANATGTTAVTIANADGAVAKDTITVYNASGTKINIAGFVNSGAAFTGGGTVSARATDDATNTVVQIDMNGDGLYGANDVQITLTGVSDGSAGEGQALFGIVSGSLSIL